MAKQEDICRDWAQLPEDLLIDIAKRLKRIEQMSAFSAVCSSWRAVSHTVKLNWTPAIPCLLFPLTTENDLSCDWSVFDLGMNKHCKCELTETLPRYYQDCGDGWIFTVSPYLEAQLFNPLTKAQISFPSTESFPLMVAITLEKTRSDCIRRAIVVKIPPNDELIVFLVYDLACIAFAKPGDDVWTFDVDAGTTHTCVEDVIVFKGQILILFGEGRLVGSSLDLFLTDRENLVFQEYVAGDFHGNISIYGEDSLEKLYLVESFGDVLVVVRHTKNYMKDDDLEGISLVCATLWFEVFKLDSEAREWVDVDDLGDVSLFVGNHSVMAVSASNSTNCKPNCIYFIDEMPYHPIKLEWRGIGIFDLQSGEMEELYPEDRERYILSSHQAPFWFMPKFV